MSYTESYYSFLDERISSGFDRISAGQHLLCTLANLEHAARREVTLDDLLERVASVHRAVARVFDQDLPPVAPPVRHDYAVVLDGSGRI